MLMPPCLTAPPPDITLLLPRHTPPARHFATFDAAADIITRCSATFSVSARHVTCGGLPDFMQPPTPDDATSYAVTLMIATPSRGELADAREYVMRAMRAA